jgi:ParB/RepB/Spo0J family partition protein
MAAIWADPTFNARTAGPKGEILDGEGARASEPSPDSPGVSGDGTVISGLAENIKKYGLISPLVVRPLGPKSGAPKGKTHALVAGFRRYAALTLLEMPMAPCIVRDLNDLDAYLINLAENVQRENLSPGEIAERAVMLRDEHDFGGIKLANALGLSKSYCNNIMRLCDGLDPKIWKLARSGKHANCPPQNVLLKWAALEDKEAQLPAYAAWCGAAEIKNILADGTEVAGEGAGNGAPVPGGIERPARTHKAPSKDALDVVRKLSGRCSTDDKLRKACGGQSAEYARGVMAGLTYAIGKLGRNGKAPLPPYKEPEKVEEEDAS